MPKGVYIRTDYHRKRMSDAQKRNPHRYWLGKHISEETKDKLREINKGKYIENQSVLWKGDRAKQSAGNARAISKYPILQKCEICNNENTIRHHIDKNTLNNNPNNIQFLCLKCHGRIHAWTKLIANL